MAVNPPDEALEITLTSVDRLMQEVSGDHPTGEIPILALKMAIAQVSATCALVHAVRELTQEIRRALDT